MRTTDGTQKDEQTTTVRFFQIYYDVMTALLLHVSQTRNYCFVRLRSSRDWLDLSFNITAALF